MRRLALFATFLLVVLVLAAPAYARLKWDLPSASVTHASDGMGFTNGSLSLHRVFSSRHSMFDTFDIYGTTYTWTRPGANTFLQPGWAYDSITSCGQCHTSISPGNSTPAAGYPGLYENLRLDPTAADGMTSTTGEAVICEKCHDLVNGTTWSNDVHGSSRHRGSSGQCVMCHTQLPHGSGLPRMLGYAQDPSPYSTVTGGLQAIALKDYTPTSWRKRDCYSSCHGNGPGASPWPSGGSVEGVVSDSSGSPISGAVVLLRSGASDTTAADGTYRIDNVGAGYTRASVSATGYSGAYASVTITAGSILPYDAVLTASP